MDSQILELLNKKFEEEKKRIVESLGDGTAKDYAEYQHLCGIIHGIRICQREIQDFVERIKRNDE